MISLFCDELRAIRDFRCCPGCHQKDKSGELDFYVANFNVDGESVFVHGCCGANVCSLKAEMLGPAIEKRRLKMEIMTRSMENALFRKPDETDAEFRERILKLRKASK